MSENYKRFCIVEKRLNEHHAGSKARNDVADILKKNKWKEITVTSPGNRTNAGLKDKVLAALTMRKEWKEIVKSIPVGSVLLFQYPLEMFPKIAILASRYIKMMHQKGVKIIILIHDLDSLRENDINRKQWDEKSEELFLKQADIIIAHNSRMIEYLEKKGVGQKKIPLEMFDYLETCLRKDTKNYPDKSGPITIAGNLDPIKAGYVYDLGELDGQVNFRLYGPGYRPEEKNGNVEYVGTYPPDELLQKIEGAYGLVWDGESIEGCIGGYGEYMKYNNPHKLSFYIAAGLPVIVWKEAAIAKFVEENGIGFSVGSLNEISRKREEITDKEYMGMISRIEKFSDEVREGYFLNHAIDESIEWINS